MTMTASFLNECKNIFRTQGRDALYYVNADAFLREGEECVSVVPLSDDSGVIGIVLEHSFWNEEDGFFESYQEIFEFPDEEKEEIINTRKQRRAIRIERNKATKREKRERRINRKNRRKNHKAQYVHFHNERFAPAPDRDNFVAAMRGAMKLVTPEEMECAKRDVEHTICCAHDALGTFDYEEADDNFCFLFEQAHNQADLRRLCALIAAFRLSVFKEQFDGSVEVLLPDTRTCMLLMILHPDWEIKDYLNGEIGLAIERWTPEN